MYASDIRQHLRRVQQELKGGTPETQDSAINELHNALEDSSYSLFPSLFYPSCINVLTYYCQALLPHLNMLVEDRQCIQHAFECTIDRLHTQEQHARDLEAHINRFLLQVRGGQFDTAADLVTAFASVIRAVQNFRRAHVPPYDGSEDEMFPVKALEKQYRALKKSPFTAKHVRPFFESVIYNAFSHHCKEQFEWMQSLFWHCLNDLLQMKAVLVNTLTKEAVITRLDVETRLESCGLDELDFENKVDERMYLSCWNAIQAARDFLEQHFPDVLKDHYLRVLCRFPNPAAEYNDASASLLVGLKVVGDVLDMQIDPQVVVSGEVDEAGRILPVNHVAAKFKAAEQHPAIQQLYLPQNGTYLVSKQVAIVTESTFSNAIYDYYDEQLPNNLRLPISRRQLVKGIVTTLAAPPVFWAFKNIFTHSVAEQDWWSIEYAEELCWKHGNYQKAVDIFETIVRKFSYESSIEVQHIKAYALMHLGRMYMQQCHTNKGFSAYHRALELWQSIHDVGHQADTLLYIGISHANLIAANMSGKDQKGIAKYFTQALEALPSSMETFPRLQGNTSLWTGFLYHAAGEDGRAREWISKSLECFNDLATSWNYQLSRQHLGRVLVTLGRYAEAAEILHSTLESPVLQTPSDQIESLAGLCELLLTTGKYDEGLQYAAKSKKLCEEHGLRLQQQKLKNILAKHKFAFSTANC